jgi:hypothetical protein
VSGISYLDFDLKIERDGSRYRALVLSSPAGQASQIFDAPFSDLELENFLLRLGRPRRGVRRADSPEVVAVKKFGGDLFGATFREEVLVCLRSSMDEATRQNAGLRIRLHLTEVPELADLPWEFLYYQAMNRFLVLSDVTPVVRYLDLPEAIRPHAFRPPLRVLVMISSPSDFPALEVEKEWEKLHSALAELEQRGLVLLQRLDDATPASLRRRLRQEEFHVFHFIGHGGFDPATQDGVLILEDEQHRGRRMSGADLGMILHDHRPMRLAVLNACEGARASRSDPFGGTAQSLVQQGIPAVIAMQFEITDLAAITFAQEFYQALADNYPADAALAEARKAICDGGLVPEWGTPVLYLRARDGRLFDVQTLSAEERSSTQADALLRAAEKAKTQENWTMAAEKLELLLALRPTDSEVQTKLRRVRQREQAEKFFRQGCDAAQGGRWSEAIEAFQRARGMSGNIKDVEARIVQAQTALEKENAARIPPPPADQGVQAAGTAAVAAQPAPPRPAAPWPPPQAQVAKAPSNTWLWAALGSLATIVMLVLLVMVVQRPAVKTTTDPNVAITTSPANTTLDSHVPLTTGPEKKHTTEQTAQSAKRSEPETLRSEPKRGGASTPERRSTNEAAAIVPPGVPPPEVPIEDQILEKYVAATGGSAAWSALTSRLATGTFTMLPVNVSGRYTSYARAPNKSVEEYALPTGGFIRQGYDGAIAWTSDPKQGVRQLYGQEAAEAAREADFYGDIHLHEHYPKIKYVGEQQLGAFSTYVLELIPRSGSPRTVYLDKLSGLPLRTDGVQSGPEGSVPVQVYFEDYREVDGIRIPFRMRQVSSQFTMVIQVLQVRHNLAVNDSVFAKPLIP